MISINSTTNSSSNKAKTCQIHSSGNNNSSTNTNNINNNSNIITDSSSSSSNNSNNKTPRILNQINTNRCILPTKDSIPKNSSNNNSSSSQPTKRNNFDTMKTALATALVTMAISAKAQEDEPLTPKAPVYIDRSYIATLEVATPEECALASAKIQANKVAMDGYAKGLLETAARPNPINTSCFVTFTGSESLKNYVETMDGVVDIEQDQMVFAAVDQSNPTWGIDRLDGAINNRYATDFTGAGATVFVIDTGIWDTHTNFQGRADQIADFSGEGDSLDGNGHGTHCAGTVGSATYGVAKGVTLKGIKVLTSSGSGSNAGVINGINYAVQQAGSRSSVLSMSLGGGASTATDNAVNAASNAGHIVVVASGNDNSNACNYSPARAGGNGPNGGVITVNSMTTSDARSSFSNYGSCTDIWAPGSSITSTWRGSNSAVNTISGTSMACPHVAGAAALFLQKHNFNKNAAVADLFASAQTNQISNVLGSPNLLVQVPEGTAGPVVPSVSPTPTTPFPTPSPTRGPWRCPASWFGASDGCDCECGGGDPDCNAPYNTLYCAGTAAPTSYVCVNDECVFRTLSTVDLLASGRTDATFPSKSTETESSSSSDNGLFVGLGIGAGFAALVALVALVANRQSVKSADRAAALSIATKPDESL